MRKYLSFFKLGISVGLQYRFSAIAGLATQFFWGFMMILLYEAFYKNGIPTPMNWKELVSYIWVGQAFYAIVFFRIINKEIFESLRTGQIAYELIRPLNIYWMWFVKICAQRISACVLRLIPIVVVAFLLPEQFALELPNSFGAFALFFITLILGLFISTALAMMIYIFMFYTTSCVGLYNAYAAIATFLSGMNLPIGFMPEFFQTICFILPFRLCMDLPMRLYVGNIPISEGINSVLLQIVWIMALIYFGNLMMKRVSERVVVQGG